MYVPLQQLIQSIRCRIIAASLASSQLSSPNELRNLYLSLLCRKYHRIRFHFRSYLRGDRTAWQSCGAEEVPEVGVVVGFSGDLGDIKA